MGGDVEVNPGPDEDDDEDDEARTFESKPNPTKGLASTYFINLFVSLVCPLGEFAASATTVTKCG